MEELLDNVLVLVPVALLIFLRVFAEAARKRVEKAKKTAAGAQSQPAAPVTQARSASQARRTKPSGSPYLAGRNSGTSSSKAKPAGQGLFGRLRDYLSGTRDQPAQRLEPLHFEEEAARKLGQFTPKNADVPASKYWIAPVLGNGPERTLEEASTGSAKPASPKGLPQSLDRLPPLKRAIVLSELLGKPKSLQ